MPPKRPKFRFGYRLSFQAISWQIASIILVATGLQGVSVILALWWGFVTNNLVPFYTVLAGTGWFAFIISTLLKLEST